MKKQGNTLLILVLIISILTGLVPFSVNAASFKYKYNGKTVTYKGIVPTVKYNDTKISLSQNPGILVNDVAMLPYYEVFVKKGPKATKSYNSKTKKLTLTHEDTKIVMTVGKKTAYVNGSKVTLPVAPMQVKYISSGRSRILVPSRKIAGYLGLSYDWNSKSKVISMNEVDGSGSNHTSSDNTTASNSNKKVTYYKNGVKKTAKVCNLYWTGAEVGIDATPAMTINSINMVPYNNALVKKGPGIKKSYKSSTGKLKLIHNGNVLTMTVGNKYADLNGETVKLSTAPIKIRYKKSGSNYILVPIKSVATYLGIHYSYSSKTRNIELNQGLSIKYNDSYKAYNDIQGSVMANGMQVSSAIPALRLDGVWYIPAKAICNSAYGLGITYSYKSKKATFLDLLNEVVMNSSSTAVAVNGSGYSMPAKMWLVRLTNKKTNYVMIPAEYFCSLFGLGYSESNGSITITPATKIYPIGIPETTTTKYNTTFDNFVNMEYDRLSSPYKKSVSLTNFAKYLQKEADTTEGYKYLRLDTYRSMKVDALNTLIASNYSGKRGILQNHAQAIDDAAKKYKIDPVAFAMQCIHETAWGTSTLAKGITSDTVAIPIYNSKKEITGFETDSKGNYKTTKLDKAVTAYNLFGIKAYDSAAHLCAFTYAYYNGWTTIPAAIEGGAKYISENYIHNATYKQNTFFKFRFHPNTTYIWHQYATDPGYAEKIGVYMKKYKYLYGATATFQYDYPEFLQ